MLVRHTRVERWTERVGKVVETEAFIPWPADSRTSASPDQDPLAGRPPERAETGRRKTTWPLVERHTETNECADELNEKEQRTDKFIDEIMYELCRLTTRKS
jgi:hypothetical protein